MIDAPDDLDIPPFLDRRDAVKCLRCGATIPLNKVDAPDRCGDWRCPLNGAAVNEQLAQAHRRATGQSEVKE